MLRNRVFPSVAAVALIAGMFAVATVSCSKKDDKNKQTKPTKKPDDGKTKPTTKVDAAATPVTKAGTDGKTNPDGDTKPDTDADDKGKKPSNLKVLPKNWTHKQVKTYMKKVFGRGLGQKCKFCHNPKDYADDGNKHKVLARKMMLMTNDLNKKFFGGKKRVTCFTCHLGKKEPEEH